MGFFKKIFKPVSKVLDKVIPNEIKPFLPYAAAFAPMLLPQTGIMGSMLGRGLISGGLNIGAQLAQEGSEGDFNELSALLAGGLGSLSAQGTPGTRTMHPTEGVITSGGTPGAAEYFRGLSDTGGITDKALNFVGTGAEKLQNLNRAALADPFSTAGLKGAIIPFSQGSGDVMYAEGREAQKDYERALQEYEATMGDAATDEGRALAIRAAMEAGQHSEEVIEETLRALGFKDGGRVGLEFGGIPSAVENIENKEVKENMKVAQEMDIPMEDLLEEFMIIHKRKPSSYQELLNFYKDKYGFRSEVTETVKETITAADGGRINFSKGGDGDLSEFSIGKYRPFKYTGAIDDLWKMNLEDGSPLEYIFKIGMTVRAPLIDVIRGVAKTTAEAGKLIASATKMGLDLTKPVRELIGDVGEFTFDTGIAAAKESYDKARYLSPWYYAQRFGGEKRLSDDETRLIQQLGDSRGKEDLIEELKEKVITEKVGNESPDTISMSEIELAPDVTTGETYRFSRADGGMMSVLPKGMEMDYRQGGMIPIGSEERADDVPARVSKNEFVMTADAVRAAGGGNVNKGAQRMYNLMNNLEARV